MAYLGLIVFVGIIVAVVKIVLDSKTKENNSSNKTTTKTNKFIKQSEYNYSKEELSRQAKIKLSRISQKKKDKYLTCRKRFLKSLYITLGTISSIFALSGVILCILTQSLYGLAVIIPFTIFSIIMFSIFTINIKKSDDNLILCQICKELKKIYSQMNNERINKYTDFVKKHSPMWKNIKELNYNYVFDRNICKQHKFEEYLNGKKQFDSFNYEKWLIQKISENSTLFNKFESVYNENSLLYKEYSKEYSKLEHYREEIDIEDLDLDYETFNIIEKKIFVKEKKAPVDAPSVKVEYSYTSPSGRNYYNNSYTYSYYQILKLIKTKEEQELLEQEEFEKKQKILEEKRAKEKRLRELDKLEKQLQLKEQNINAKQKEFEEATKGHIYSTEQTNEPEVVQKIEDDDSPYIKLKKLKEQFENGEISFEEYTKRKNELI